MSFYPNRELRSRKRKDSAMKAIFGTLLILPMVIYIAATTWLGLRFDWDCCEYLHRAANASTIDMAEQSLDVALKYCEDHGLTKGSTGIIIHNPANDIGYWYTNLVNSRTELEDAKKAGTSLFARVSP